VLLAWPAARAVQEGYSASAAALLAISLGVGVLLAVWYSRTITGHEPLFPPRAPQKSMLAAALRISLPTLAIFAVGAVTAFLLRALVVQQFGIASAGLFDAAWTLSTVGIGLLLTTVSAYLLPATGIEKSESERAELLESALRVVILISVPVIGIVACAKVLLLRLFYAADFVDASEVLRWMLLGEYVKIGGWLLATVAYARGHILAYAVIETIWSASILLLAVLLAHYIGSPAALGMSYLGAYIVYLCGWLVYAMRRHFLALSGGTLILWVAGAGLVTGISAVFWSARVVPVWSTLLVAAIVATFSAAAARPSERTAIALLAKRVLRRSF
jgi:PST family polysaccharide transporter